MLSSEGVCLFIFVFFTLYLILQIYTSHTHYSLCIFPGHLEWFHSQVWDVLHDGKVRIEVLELDGKVHRCHALSVESTCNSILGVWLKDTDLVLKGEIVEFFQKKIC
jgi:hypothetical protein